jgi:hypothetical protein
VRERERADVIGGAMSEAIVRNTRRARLIRDRLNHWNGGPLSAMPQPHAQPHHSADDRHNR